MPSSLPPVAQPKRNAFDPWNSASTGHQHAQNRLSGSTSWRDSRSLKLAHQFADAEGRGGKRLSDTVGAGSLGFGKDGRKENGDWERGASGLREEGWRDVKAMLLHGGTKEREQRRKEKEKELQEWPEINLGINGNDCYGYDDNNDGDATYDERHGKDDSEVLRQRPETQILAKTVLVPSGKHRVFDGVTVYINGSTAPTISDHKLKHLLVEHGAHLSIALGRRTVSHVIIGRPNTGALGDGAGGGLSGSKLEKEIRRLRGCAIRFVGVEWVLESIKAGKRLPEWRFDGGVRTAPRGVKSVADMLGGKTKKIAAAAPALSSSCPGAPKSISS